MPDKVRIPKKIAGVKLPKQVRKKARKAIKASASPVVREIAAAAIGAAKAGGWYNRDETGARRFEGRARIEIDGDKIGEAFRAAAIDGLRRFLEGFEEGLRKAQAESDDPQGRPKAARKAKAKKSRAGAKSSSRAPAA